MSKLTIGSFLSCVLAVIACNGDSTGPVGTATDPFLGTWACANQRTVTFTMPPGAGTRMESTMSTLNIVAEAGGLAVSEESDGAPSCKVTFTSNGKTATLNAGQSCMRSEGLTLTYKSGSATVNGSAMNSMFEFDATGTVSSGGMMVAAAATGSQSSTCSRLSAPPGEPTGGGNTTGGGW
ncbi:MAG: hypothetical protein ABW133_22615 [Polyangiaceae bacterium]